MTFINRLTTLLFLLLIFPQIVFAQEVSTLLFDSSREFESMHWLPNGRIFSVDYSNGRVYEIFLDGTVETKLSGFNNLVGGGYDSENNFFVSNFNSGEILKLNDDGTSDVVADGFSQPVSVLQDSTNPDKYYVSEYQTSEVSSFLLSTGVRTSWVEDNGIFKPDGLIYDWNGDIFVANFENHKINRIDADGNISLYTNLGVSNDMGYIAIVGDYLYVPSFSGRQLYRVDQDGNFEVIAGSGNSSSTDGAGLDASFLQPNGICSNLTGDTLLISDRNSIRVVTNFAPETTSIAEASEADWFYISPNPSHETIYVNLMNEINGPFSWAIIDTEGKEVATRTMVETNSSLFKIDVQHLVPGVYMFQLFSRENKSIQRFVKMAP